MPTITSRKNLRLNMKGPDVKKLQKDLKQLGFDIANSELGRFGSSTREAVCKFQKSKRLQINGIVNEKTSKAILKEMRALNIADSMPGSISGRTKVPKTFFRPEVLNSKLTDIKKLKKEDKDYISNKLNKYLHEEIVSIVANGNERIREAVKDTVSKIDFDEFKDSDLSYVILEKILPKVKNEDTLKEEIKDATSRIAKADLPKISDYLNFDRPLNENPILNTEILRAKIFTYAKLAKLNDDAAEKLADEEIDFYEAGEPAMDDLVKKGIINDKQKKDLTLINALGCLTGDNVKMVTALKTDQLKSPADLVSWEKEDWVKMIKDNKIPPPPGETIESYADTIYFSLENTYTTEFLLNRILNPAFINRLKNIDSLNGLLNKNDKLISYDKSFKVNWKGISAAQKKKLEESLREITELANTYRHLGTVDLINDKTLSVAAKKKAILSKINLISTFNKLNPDIDITQTNFFELEKDSTKWGTIKGNDKKMVINQLMSFQRVTHLAINTKDRQTLLANGYDAAVLIVDNTDKTFIKKCGLAPENAKLTYAKAIKESAFVTNYFETLGLMAVDKYLGTRVSNLSSKFLNVIKDIDGYDELFGSQNFCDCDDCNSILSPAAYFVDLMHFIEQHVSEEYFPESSAWALKHPLYLKNRRADLWQLKLTCENTNRLIPYLTIVNEVLETYVGKVIPSSNVFKKLSLNDTNKSFLQPFNLPLEEIRLYLNHFNISLHEIFKRLRLNEDKIWRAKLNLSKEEYVVITCPVNDNNLLDKRYSSPSTFNNFDVQEFIRIIGINRDELTELLELEYFSILNNLIVNVTSVDDIEQFEEKLKNLTYPRLDFVHRFVRLKKKTPWTFNELDLIFAAMKQSGEISNSSFNNEEDNIKAVTCIAKLVDIQEQFQLTIDELCAMVGQLPVSKSYPTPPKRENDKKMFERIFDPKKLFGEVGGIIGTTTTFHHYKFNNDNNDKETSTILPHLLSGLGITETELLTLLDLLKNKIVFDSAGDCKSFDKSKVSILYRHARIAKGLKVSIDDLVRSCRLNFLRPDPSIQGVLDIHQLIEFTRWLKASAFNLESLCFILNGDEGSTLKYQMDINKIVKLVLDNQSDTRGLKVEVLKEQLAQILNMTNGQIDRSLLWINSSVDSADILTALATEFNDDGTPITPLELDPLLQLVNELERIKEIIDTLNINETSFNYITNNPSVLGIANIKSLKISNLVALDYYQQLTSKSDDIETTTHEVLSDYMASGMFSDNSVSNLSDLWQKDASLVDSLVRSLSLPITPIDAVKYISNCLDICMTLGVNGFSLQKIGDDTGYNTLCEARDIALGAFSSKYDDEAIREEKLEPYRDKINLKKRDILCDYIINCDKKLNFKDYSDIYNFFLLDAEMSGCFRASRLVCAISSLQLYVHRCLLFLEQTDEELFPLERNIDILPSAIPKNEWEWRKNYRVWEANRKVFLYPENYIEPDLRDNKSHIFKELEEELLQEKITKESAENAYMKYIKQFAELSKLRIAGSYYEEAEDPEDNVYYLFARTNTDPYQYYYRTFKPLYDVDMKKNVIIKGDWDNWIKMELSIEAKEISAIKHLDRLFIFWTDSTCKEISKIDEGTPTSGGYLFKLYTKYSYLNEDGTWSAPQKIYTGYIKSFDDTTLYFKVWHGAKSRNRSEDAYHEITVDKFTSLVFRKPYPVATNNEKTPISLYHLWSHKDAGNEVRYVTSTLNKTTTVSITYTPGGVINDAANFVEDFFGLFGADVDIDTSVTVTLPITVTLLQHEFTITNNNFPQTINSPAVISTFPATGELTLSSASNCRLYLSVCTPFGTVDISFPVPANKASGTKYYSEHNLSLAMNSIIHSPESKDKDPIYITALSSSDSFDDEYDMLIASDKNFSGYVQDGSKNFTDANRVVIQNELYSQIYAPTPTGGYSTMLLSTLMADNLNMKIFAHGLENFLTPDTQRMTDDSGFGIDFDGPYGNYFWELFFHIPFTIANHLNANQKFKEARWWYERIFDPTASKEDGDLLPADKNWRFIKFKNATIKKMKDILADAAAIKAYKEDPFNPHAIARLRTNAYQKTIVMKYIDNLLDWGDHLFAQDTMESINEATMLYVLAADILGKRPVSVGKCKTADDKNMNYDAIKDSFDNPDNSEFLLTIESLSWSHRNVPPIPLLRLEKYSDKLIATWEGITSSDTRKLVKLKNRMLSKITVETAYDNTEKKIGGYKRVSSSKMNLKEMLDRIKAKDIDSVVSKRPPALGFIKQQSVLVFCIPHNKDLLEYWSRVEDRLFKIRHCMNISGVRRQLALFQPPIDPMALVRAKAAGLSLEDILNAIASQVPHYRFSYLIEKAKQFTQTVQSFGSNLLSALEKKDMEELTLLRTVHERNILQMTKAIKKKQVKESQAQFKGMEEALVNVQNRVDHYKGLVSDGLTGWETTQQISKHAGTILTAAETVLRLTAGISHLVPQVGSPFAMKYGGKEMGDSQMAFSEFVGALARISDAVSASAGLEATFQRREQEWKQQLKLAEQELKQIDKQVQAAEIRCLIAEKDLEIHEKNIEQAEELDDFYKNKFSGLGLYNYLASTLSRLYRQAYNTAYDMAKMAERAYQFEIDNAEIIIANDNWRFDRAGLLAGERLQLQLQKLEQLYIENNVRVPEITQSFSLAIFDSDALLDLKANGSCTFKIPEIFYDLYYPGQYKRIIKSVQISIPCVTGPYTNISTKLTLESSQVRNELPDLTATTIVLPLPPLAEVPYQTQTSIATSKAQNDSGTFELNFRDERYLPFEGAGAISSWKIEMPSTLRPFNYNTISDVIVHINYTAKEDGLFRERLETVIASTLSDYATTHGLHRLISLKSEFANAFHKLLNPTPVDGKQETSFTLSKECFPYIFSDADIAGLSLTEVKVYLKSKTTVAVPTGSLSLKINGVTTTDWSDFGEDLTEGTVAVTGNPMTTWNIDAGVNGFDKDILDDIIILVKYTTT